MAPSGPGVDWRDARRFPANRPARRPRRRRQEHDRLRDPRRPDRRRRRARAPPGPPPPRRTYPARLRVLHTSDYKLDHTPVDGLRTDVGKLAEIGNRGVDLLLGDSTNAERPGFTGSERLVGEAFRQIIPGCPGRVLIATFASNVHRMQQAIDVAAQVGRKVAVVGRSMRKNFNISRNLGYIQVPSDDLVIRPNDLEEYARHEV